MRRSYWTEGASCEEFSIFLLSNSDSRTIPEVILDYLRMAAKPTLANRTKMPWHTLLRLPPVQPMPLQTGPHPY